MLTNRKIIFEELQPMWSESTNVTDRRPDGQTTSDGNRRNRSSACRL